MSEKISESFRVVTPAYGRDYKSAKEAHDAFLGGKDFTLQPDGVYCSIRDFEPNVIVTIRFNKRRTTTPVEVPS